VTSGLDSSRCPGVQSARPSTPHGRVALPPQPAHRSTAGAGAAVHRFRNLHEQRSFSLRDANRTNLLLGLARLHLDNRDDVVPLVRARQRSRRAVVVTSGG
jgi:hypothetical protein